MSGPWRETPEAATRAGFAASTFEKLRCYGGGPRYSKRGRKVVYHDDDVDAWLRAASVQSTSEPAVA
jgi:hypothetical protein